VNDRPGVRNIVATTRMLALLHEQADDLRNESARLRRELAEAQRQLGGTYGAELRDTNEQLVLTALRAEDVAARALADLRQSALVGQRDVLTNLPNRALMLDRLEQCIALARRHKTRFAVLFLDLDDFKQINDTLGHAVGDVTLQSVAGRLESVVRDSDTVSRHGGDEFLVLLSEIAEASDAGAVAVKLLLALARPIEVGDRTVCPSASIGITIYPEHGADVSTLVRRADEAMYRAKRMGRGSFLFHDDDAWRDANPAPSAIDVSAPPHSRQVAPEHGSELNNLREANEQLVISALSAQELEADAEDAHRKQIHFLAMVAHELRNPLGPIRLAAEVLSRAPADAPLLAELLVVIKRQAAHMSKLVEDLLDGSRVSTGKFRLLRSSVQISGPLGLALETCQAAIAAKKQHLDVRVPSDLPSVHGDQVRLAQVFTNLLDNASKYTPAGGHIALSVAVPGNAMEIIFSDDGIGITEEALPNIFDLFVQEERALAIHNGGLGLGLAIVRELVEAHGGTVVGSSAGTDRGSRFTVTLPLADRAIAVAG
jgi:diguanylate cyclase (GGDEF)-like protein